MLLLALVKHGSDPAKTGLFLILNDAEDIFSFKGRSSDTYLETGE